MPKIKLKTLKLPATKGTLKIPTSSSSSTGYSAITKAISEIYIQDQTGELIDVDFILAQEFRIWTPHVAIENDTVPEKSHKIIINTVEYNIMEIANRNLSYLEDHWDIRVKEPNT